MKLFTEIEEQILKQLAHYKYMTLSQLVKTGTGGKSYVSTRLKQLRDAGMVGVSQYGGVYRSGGGGRAENINYLLPRGAKLLAENTEGLDIAAIHFPKNIDGMFRNDYFHRISTVNSQIAFELWAKSKGFEVLFFDTYFHKVGSAKTAKDDNPLKSITRVTFDDGSFIEPDASFLYQTPERLYLMALEVHNGKDVTRLVTQLKRLSLAVSKGMITALYKERYGVKTSPRILCTLETAGMLQLVQKRMGADPFFNPDWMQKAFLFKVAEQAWDDFANGWQNYKGAVFNLSSL